MTEAMTRGVPLSSTAKLRKFGNIMKQQSKEFFKDLCIAISGITLAFLLTGALLVCIMLGSCTKRIYVPVEHSRIEYRDADTTKFTSLINELRERLSQKESHKESLMHKEKETVTLNEKGDTTKHDHFIYISLESEERSEYERTIESQKDSITKLNAALNSVKVDSIPIPYPVERKLTGWERTKMDFGGMFLGGLIAVVVSAVIVWIVKRKRRK